MTTVIVRVTAEMIARNRHCTNDCPVHEGMVNAGVRVNHVTMKYWTDHRGEKHDFHPKVSDWIMAYDTLWRPAEPFYFSLDVETGGLLPT